MNLLIVTLTWPNEPDRSPEVVGPFGSEEYRETWVTRVSPHMPGVLFTLDTLLDPLAVESYQTREV